MERQLQIYQGAFACVIICIIIIIINVYKLAELPKISEYTEDGIKTFYPVSYYIRETGQDVTEETAKYFVSYQSIDKLDYFTDEVDSEQDAKLIIEQNIPLEKKILVSNVSTNNNKIIEASSTLSQYFSELKSPCIRWIISAILGVVVIALIVAREFKNNVLETGKTPLHDK